MKVQGGYIPDGDENFDKSKPPKFESAIQDPKQTSKNNTDKKRSAGEVIDELLNNPHLIMDQCTKIVAENKKKLEEAINKNEKLEKEKIEKDNQIEYLSGKIDGMEYVIEHLMKEE